MAVFAVPHLGRHTIDNGSDLLNGLAQLLPHPLLLSPASRISVALRAEEAHLRVPGTVLVSQLQHLCLGRL